MRDAGIPYYSNKKRYCYNKEYCCLCPLFRFARFNTLIRIYLTFNIVYLSPIRVFQLLVKFPSNLLLDIPSRPLSSHHSPSHTSFIRGKLFVVWRYNFCIGYTYLSTFYSCFGSNFGLI